MESKSLPTTTVVLLYVAVRSLYTWFSESAISASRLTRITARLARRELDMDGTNTEVLYLPSLLQVSGCDGHRGHSCGLL